MKKSVLIVDDDELVLTGLAANLEGEGFRALTASSAAQALDWLARESVDLVLTDLVMEGMDGLGLLRQLGEQRPDVPVVVITGHGTANSAVEALRHGAADYIQKPCHPEDISHRVRTILDTRQLQSRLLNERRRAEAHQRALVAQRDMEGRLLAVTAALRCAAADSAKELGEFAETPVRGAGAHQVRELARDFAASAPGRALRAERPRLALEWAAEWPAFAVRLAPGVFYRALSALIAACRVTAKDAQAVRFSATALEDGAALFMVHCGVKRKPDELHRFFDPDPGGVGLEPPLAWWLLRKLDLPVRLELEGDHELTVQIRLPRAAADREPAAAAGRRPAHVLVVDDSAEQRAEAVALLEGLGFSVSAAADGREALARLADTSSAAADLVLLDLVLGDELDGVEVYRRLAEINPRQKVILMGGFAETGRIVAAKRMGVRLYLQKPLTRAALERALAQVLAAD